jgi:hypothetical protein
MMDTDQNGIVSKDAFMRFVGRQFDRLDVDKSGTLEPKSCTQSGVPNCAAWLAVLTARSRNAAALNDRC